ncbi:MAG: hypothetical protein HZB14_03965 [Actinobacteria bacterium]|nr:hypothetical protein [Actinomycetota bacterium]
MRKFLDSARAVRITIFAIASLLLIAASATAVGGDRNRDGIPDRWAKRHGLNAKKNQAHRDQDRDRVENLCEYESGLDPRDKNSDDDRRADGREDSDHDGMVNSVESQVETDCDDEDSDDDGMDDGDEISGYVHSLDGDILRIRMVDGTILKAPLNEWAYIQCMRDEFAEKPDKGEEPPAESEPVEPDGVSTAQNDGEPVEDGCGVEALVPGRVVKAFFVEDGYFVKIKLLL